MQGTLLHLGSLSSEGTPLANEELSVTIDFGDSTWTNTLTTGLTGIASQSWSDWSDFIGHGNHMEGSDLSQSHGQVAPMEWQPNRSHRFHQCRYCLDDDSHILLQPQPYSWIQQELVQQLWLRLQMM